jgi:hypothetical protein
MEEGMHHLLHLFALPFAALLVIVGGKFQSKRTRRSRITRR